MVMQIQVHIRDARRVFMNPPESVEDFKKTKFCVRFRRHVLWILVHFTRMIKENT